MARVKTFVNGGSLTPADLNSIQDDYDAKIATTTALANTAVANIGLPLALPGAAAPVRFAGGTVSGKPLTGTFAVGDLVPSQAGELWLCVSAGSPGTFIDIAGVTMIGSVLDWAGFTDPTDTRWKLADGRAVSRATYSTLFSTAVPALGAPTITIATPGVVTLASHGLKIGDKVYFTTTGSLPTGLAINTIYYVATVPSSSTFTLATTLINALAGTAINTSGAQSGVHTVRACPYGLGDGTTTFNLPDYRGNTSVGPDDMGTAQGAAGRLQGARARGNNPGAESVTLTVAQMPSHVHSVTANFVASSGAVKGWNTSLTTAGLSSTFTNVGQAESAGNDQAHTNMQPSLIVPKIIRVA